MKLNYVEVFNADIGSKQAIVSLYVSGDNTNPHNPPQEYSCAVGVVTSVNPAEALEFSRGNAGMYAAVSAPSGVLLVLSPEIEAIRAIRAAQKPPFVEGAWKTGGVYHRAGVWLERHAQKKRSNEREKWRVLSKKRLQPLREYRVEDCSIRYLPGRNIITLVENGVKAVIQVADFADFAKFAADRISCWNSVLSHFRSSKMITVIR